MMLRVQSSTLVLVDLQQRLMPAIENAGNVIANAAKLRDAAALLQVPVLVTEQNPAGLGGTDPRVAVPDQPALEKMFFDATREAAWRDWIVDPGRTLVVAGCEAHVCVLQTVLGILEKGGQVALVADAVGSRVGANRDAALARAAAHGAQIVTTEMVIFEWLETCRHPQFREVLKLVK